jgi:predicted MFS family arabinose efflux permease
VGNVLLSTADGRRFLIAQLMDSLGAGLSFVVLPWLVLDAGGTASEAGLAFLVGTIPYVLLGLPAGDVGDRHQRRRVMELGVMAQLGAAVVIPAIVLVGADPHRLPLALIYATGLGVTAGRVFVDAAAFGAVSRLVGEGNFVEGQAGLSFVWSLGLLVGPAIGGALIGLLGASEALWVQAAGFALAWALIATMKVDLGPGERSTMDSGGVTAGLMLVVRDPMLRMLTTVGMAWNLVVNMMYALIVVFARGELHADGPATGWMLAIGGGAGVLGGLAAPIVHRRLGAGPALRVALLGSGAGAVALALAGDVVTGTVGFSLLEAFGLLFITLLIGERQNRAGLHEQARVGITGRMAALLAATVGGLVASVLVSHMAASSVYVFAAAGTVGVALIAQRSLRAV